MTLHLTKQTFIRKKSLFKTTKWEGNQINFFTSLLQIFTHTSLTVMLRVNLELMASKYIKNQYFL